MSKKVSSGLANVNASKVLVDDEVRNYIALITCDMYNLNINGELLRWEQG